MEGNDAIGYSISDLANEFNISPRTIRYYEEIGLIQPKRTSGNHRIYSKRDRARVKMIIRAKTLGFSLEQTSSLFELYEIDPTQKKQFEEGIKLAYQHLETVQKRRKEFEELEAELLKAIRDAEEQYKKLNKET
ncbi:MerR family transcriptional regulator [Alkalihalobacterium elongatum]|uniref:MerR family transcriptional regulator n=1 Tax=Alkalihalobacterium elongatum TaxID=2675466 RepID=UPI001C1FC657|nr:MerR family transcriptional regulator [Alkalihalobacterium elongatum]